MDPARGSECTNETSPGAFDDQSEVRNLVSQRSPFPNTESDEHHGLDRDATQDVADRDVKLAARCRTVGANRGCGILRARVVAARQRVS